MKQEIAFYEKSMQTLELPAILEMLREEAVCESAKDEAQRLTPSDVLSEVRSRLEETTDAKRLISTM